MKEYVDDISTKQLKDTLIFYVPWPNQGIAEDTINVLHFLMRFH